ncbi:MAG: hypothetical protein DHS20C18_47590 [Saprospiraceae bacterium]|nr:MAG: hypothetical protein DHS20C18_47590 [Saprospiraceae bacterium]
MLTLPAFLRENRLFLLLVFAFAVLGSILLLFIEQGDVIYFFSDHRTQLGNYIFRYGTKLGEEISYFIILIILLFVGYRHALAVPFLGLTVTVVSFLAKLVFAHDRPSLYFRKQGVFETITTIDGVVLNGGANSFPSGHTMSAFALYAFLAFCLPFKKGVALLTFTIALVVGISRIYLVQHFFEDVYLGAIIGTLIAMAWYFLQFRLFPYPLQSLDGSLKLRRVNQ